MKIIALEAIELFGTHYAPGEALDVSEEAAERLLRARRARIEVHELAQVLAGKRFTTPTGKSDMRVQRR